MGSTRDSSSDPGRAGSPMRPPLSARRHPVSAIAPFRHSSGDSSRPQPPAIAQHATCHTRRHSGVYPALCGTTHLLEDGYDLSACTAQAGIRTIQELLGHKDVKPTMIYTHVLNRGGKGVRSPVDAL